MTDFLFYIFAAAAVISAVLVIVRRDAVSSALSLLVTLFSLAGIYILLNAQFVAAVQVLVYAGAIMVLFLFVIMLLNMRTGEEAAWPQPRGRVWKTLGVLLALALTFIMYLSYRAVTLTGATGQVTDELVSREGNTEVIASALFTDYLFPFELASILLLAAMIGAVALARRDGRDAGDSD